MVVWFVWQGRRNCNEGAAKPGLLFKCNLSHTHGNQLCITRPANWHTVPLLWCIHAARCSSYKHAPSQQVHCLPTPHRANPTWGANPCVTTHFLLAPLLMSPCACPRMWSAGVSPLEAKPCTSKLPPGLLLLPMPSEPLK